MIPPWACESEPEYIPLRSSHQAVDNLSVSARLQPAGLPIGPPSDSVFGREGSDHPEMIERMIQRTATVESLLRKALGGMLLTQEPLRHHTTLRIGGPADFYFAARTPDELLVALRVGRELGIPVFLLGGGSNLLVSDDGFRGLVVRNAIETIEFDGDAAHVGCGADFLDLIYQCRDRDLAGLEFAAGIPGSVGGALYGNAGCYGQDIGSFTIECTVASLDGSQ